MQTSIKRLRLKDVRLLEQNARYMRHETFATLTANLEHDQTLTSTPFLAIKGYYTAADPIPTLDTTDEEGNPVTIPVYEVLSGNHRVKAGLAAGVEFAWFLCCDEPLTEAQRVAIQLSHNSITGEDDPATLKALYDKIDTLDLRAYRGLDDKALALLANVKVGALPEASLAFQTVTLLFLPDELAAVEQSFASARAFLSGTVWAARWSDYDAYMDAAHRTGNAYHVSNVATVLHLILEIWKRHQDDLQEGYLTAEGEAKHNGWVSLATLFGRDTVPAPVAAVVKRAIARVRAEHDLNKKNLWQSLEFLAAEYLGGGE